MNEDKTSIHTGDEYENSPLYYACICGHYDVAKYLLDTGARDDKYGRCYISALVCNVHDYTDLLEHGHS